MSSAGLFFDRGEQAGLVGQVFSAATNFQGFRTVRLRDIYLHPLLGRSGPGSEYWGKEVCDEANGEGRPGNCRKSVFILLRIPLGREF
jgi:hypothetical protein